MAINKLYIYMQRGEKSMDKTKVFISQYVGKYCINEMNHMFIRNKYS